MRSVLFLVTWFLASSAFAETTDLKTALGSDCQPDSAYSPICTNAAVVICTNKSLTGCQGVNYEKGKALAPVSFQKASDVTELGTIANKLQKDAAKLQTQTENCCDQGGEVGKCSKSADAQAAAARLPAADPAQQDARINGAADAQTKYLEDSATVNNNVAGACRGYKFLTDDRLQTMSDKLDQAPCVKAGDADCKAKADELKQTFQQNEKKIKDLSTTKADLSAIQINQDLKQAKEVELTTQSTGSPSSRPGQVQKNGNGVASNAPNDVVQGAGGGGGGGTGGSTANTASGGGSGASGGGNMMSSMMPMMMAAMQAMNQQNQAQNQNAQTAGTSQVTADCSSNPALAGCTVAKGAAVSAKPAGAGDGGFQPMSREGASSGHFNLNDNADALKPASNLDPVGNNNPITTHGVSNGGGGFSGGGGGSGGAASSAGGGAGGGGGGYGSHPSADILHGEGGGGGGSGLAAVNQGMNMQTNGGGGGYAPPNPADGNIGLQLADFLPGGAKDPARHIASVTTAPQIQAKSVNIWSRISEHIRSRCAQGLLRDCGPQ